MNSKKRNQVPVHFVLGRPDRLELVQQSEAVPWTAADALVGHFVYYTESEVILSTTYENYQNHFCLPASQATEGNGANGKKGKSHDERTGP